MSNLIQSILPRSQQDLWSTGLPTINIAHSTKVQEHDLYIKDRHGNLKKKNHYFLCQQYLITSKNHIDLLFTEFKITQILDYHVLQIIKNREIFQLFSNKNLINEWAIHIRKYSFQTDFDEKYILSNYKKEGQSNHNMLIGTNVKNSDQVFVIQFEKMDYYKIDNLEILQKIQNHHIQQLLGIYKNQESFQFVLENRKGKKLDKSHFSESEIIKILSSLLKLVKELHDQKIVHRNINFNTVLLKDQEIFILGMENARYITRVDPFKNELGFIAPELMMGQEYDEKIDLYAIGALVYFLLTQKFPYLIQSNILIFNELDFHTAESQPFLKSLVRQLLNVDPKHRLSAKEALSHRCFLETTAQFQIINQENLLEEENEEGESPGGMLKNYQMSFSFSKL